MQAPSDDVLLERTIERVRRQLLGADWNDDIEVFDPSEEVEEVDVSKEKPTPAVVAGLIDLAERCRWRNLDTRVAELLGKVLEAVEAVPADQRASVLYHSCLIRVVLLYDFLGRYEHADAAASRAQKSVAQLLPTNQALVTLCQIVLLSVYQKVGKVAEGRPIFMQVVVATQKLAESAHGPQLLSALGEVFLTQGKLMEADSMYSEAHSALVKKAGVDSPKAAQVALVWAPVKRERGRYAEAEAQLTKAHEALTKAYGATSRWVARALVQLADIQRVQGKHKLALANASKAVELLRKEVARVAGLGQQEVTLSYAILALSAVQRDMGTVLEAEKTLVDVDERTRTQLGRTHPLSLLALDRRAELLTLQGKINDVETLLTPALSAAQKKSRGDANELLFVVPLLTRLTLAYEAAGRLQPAQALLQDTINLRRKWLPEDHPLLLPLMAVQARLSASLGHHTQAEGLCVRMLGIVRKLTGDENQLMFAQYLDVKLQAFTRSGQLADVVPLSGRILELKKKLLGEDNPFVVSATNAVANAYWLQQKPAEGEPIAQKAVEMAKKVIGADSLILGECLATQVRCLADLGKWQQAEPLAEQAWRLLKKAYGQFSDQVQRVLNVYISTLDGQEKYEEAIALLKYSYNILKSTHPNLDHPNIPSLLHQLSLHYWNMDQYEEANQYGDQAIETARRIFGPEHPLTAQIEEGLTMIQQDSGGRGGYDSYDSGADEGY